ncbi:MAG: DUF5684 domain-containing protein, partial [Candidatus Omnitrophota bacterium]
MIGTMKTNPVTLLAILYKVMAFIIIMGAAASALAMTVFMIYFASKISAESKNAGKNRVVDSRARDALIEDMSRRTPVPPREEKAVDADIEVTYVYVDGIPLDDNPVLGNPEVPHEIRAGIRNNGPADAENVEVKVNGVFTIHRYPNMQAGQEDEITIRKYFDNGDQPLTVTAGKRSFEGDTNTYNNSATGTVTVKEHASPGQKGTDGGTVSDGPDSEADHETAENESAAAAIDEEDNGQTDLPPGDETGQQFAQPAGRTTPHTNTNGTKSKKYAADVYDTCIRAWPRIFLVLYAFFALSLQTIAAKTGQQNSWLAWVPLANMYLMCRTAGKPWWWLALLLVPLINII